jgi:hypothetical protein
VYQLRIGAKASARLARSARRNSRVLELMTLSRNSLAK